MHKVCPKCGVMGFVINEYETAETRFRHSIETKSGAPIDCLVKNDEIAKLENVARKYERETRLGY